MIELIVKDFLQSELAVPVLLEMPQEAGTMPYVLIEKTGSSEQDYIVKSVFAVQSYGTSLFEAASLNEQVKAAFKKIIALNKISKIALNSDYNYTDTTTKKYRYQAVFEVTHY